jgi:hypothetical protein
MSLFATRLRRFISAALLALAGCGGAETGGLVVRLEFQAEAPAGGVRGALSGLAETVRLTVSRGSSTVKKADCDYEALACSLDGIDAGTGYQLVAEVFSVGEVFYRGSAERLEVKANELTPVQVVLRPAYSADVYPPAAVTDLSASVSAGAVTLAWTATGDDALAGRASEYRIFWADDPAGIEQGHPVDGPVPKAAGGQEELTLQGLPGGQTYYFGLRVVDKAQNVSLLSNVASATLP